jgi:hypothetical protein
MGLGFGWERQVDRVGDGWGEMIQCASVTWVWGWTRGSRTTHELSGTSHFRPKSEVKMGTRVELRTPWSIYIAPLGRPSCPAELNRMYAICLDQPLKDALTLCKAPSQSLGLDSY